MAAAIETGNPHKHLESEERLEERVKIMALSAREIPKPELGWTYWRKRNTGSPEGSSSTMTMSRDRTEMPSERLLKNELSLKVTIFLPLPSNQCNWEITLRKPPCSPLPVLRWNLCSGLPLELHFWWRVCNLKNCYKAKFISIIITIPMLTDGQLRLRQCYLFKVTQEIYGRTMVRTQVSRAQTKCFNHKAILFSSNSPAGTSLAECSR